MKSTNNALIERAPTRLLRPYRVLVALAAVLAMVVGVNVAPAAAATATPPSNVTAVAGDQSAVVSWAAPISNGGSPILSYTVTATPGPATVTTANGDTLTATVTGLTNGSMYFFTVHATNADGNSLESLPSLPAFPAATVPEPPTDVTAEAGDTSAVVSWTAPLTDGGSTILSYTVTASPGPATSTTADGITLSATVTGLTNGTEYTFTVHATNAQGNSAESLPSVSVIPVGSTYTALSPTRIWDSRVGPGPLGQIGEEASVDVTVAGVAGVPATGATAVVLNVTAIDPTEGTFVTAWPAGETQPVSSNINIPAGDVRPNLVTVKLGAGGKVSFYNEAGTVHLAADVAGWYGAAGEDRYTAVSPARVWDSRVGPGPVGTLGTEGTVDVTVTGTNGVPATGVSAVVLNVTGIDPTAGTFVTAWPTGEGVPIASNLNLPLNDVRANLVIVKVGANGQVSFYNEAGTIHLAADVAGYFSDQGSSFTSVSPARILDSRVGPGPVGKVGAEGTIEVTVVGVGGVPATGVTAVVLNVAAIDATVGTFVTAWPSGELIPVASNLNLPKDDVRANLVTVKVGTGGKVNFYNEAGTIDLVADVAGWYSQPGA